MISDTDRVTDRITARLTDKAVVRIVDHLSYYISYPNIVDCRLVVHTLAEDFNIALDLVRKNPHVYILAEPTMTADYDIEHRSNTV